jgi:hypothetical protein
MVCGPWSWLTFGNGICGISFCRRFFWHFLIFSCWQYHKNMSAHEFHIIHNSFDMCTKHGRFGETKMNSLPLQTMPKTKSTTNPTPPGIRKRCLHSTQILLLHSCVWMAIKVTVGSISDMVSNERHMSRIHNKGADKSLARPGRKQATVTENFDVHISHL